VEGPGLVVIPSIAHSSLGYVSDVLGVANGGTRSATSACCCRPVCRRFHPDRRRSAALVNQRRFAIPTGIAVVGLGNSRWRE
jgi:hypothetical protein